MATGSQWDGLGKGGTTGGGLSLRETDCRRGGGSGSRAGRKVGRGMDDPGDEVRKWTSAVNWQVERIRLSIEGEGCVREAVSDGKSRPQSAKGNGCGLSHPLEEDW